MTKPNPRSTPTPKPTGEFEFSTEYVSFSGITAHVLLMNSLPIFMSRGGVFMYILNTPEDFRDPSSSACVHLSLEEAKNLATDILWRVKYLEENPYDED